VRGETRIVGSTAGAVGAALTATVASLCCVGPVVVSLVGVSGAVLAAGLKPYRPYLMVGSLVLLGVSFWLAYRPGGASSRPGAACPVQSGRTTRLMLWIAAGAWVLALIVPSLVRS
jgi:mercuric ion transport protein